MLGVLSIVSSYRRGFSQLLVQVSFDLDEPRLRLFHELGLVDGDLVLPEQVILNHIVCDPECNHWVLNRVQLVNMDNTK